MSLNDTLSVSSEGILTLCNVGMRFGGHVLFNSINLNFFESQIYTLTGKNGSGKTTLLKIISNIHPPTSGSVMFCGHELWPKNQFECHEKSMFCAHEPSFFSDLSALENIQFYLSSYGLKFIENNVNEVLKIFELFEHCHKKIRLLSTGQKRRLMMVLMYLIKPKLICADEPTNGLDVSGVNLFFNLIHDLKLNHKTLFIIATHDERLKQNSDFNIDIEKYFEQSKQSAKIKISGLI